MSLPPCLAPLRREFSPGCISRARARALGCSWVARSVLFQLPPLALHVRGGFSPGKNSVRGWPCRASAASVACRCLILELALMLASGGAFIADL